MCYIMTKRFSVVSYETVTKRVCTFFRKVENRHGYSPYIGPSTVYATTIRTENPMQQVF